jgi:hypothetical protein
VGAVQELGGTVGDEPRFSGGSHQSLEELTLQALLQQLAPEVAQNGRIETLIFGVRKGTWGWSRPGS